MQIYVFVSYSLLRDTWIGLPNRSISNSQASSGHVQELCCDLCPLTGAVGAKEGDQERQDALKKRKELPKAIRLSLLFT